MNRINIMAQQAYNLVQNVRKISNRALNQVQQIGQTMSCHRPQSSDVLDNPMNSKKLPIPIHAVEPRELTSISGSSNHLDTCNTDEEAVAIQAHQANPHLPSAQNIQHPINCQGPQVTDLPERPSSLKASLPPSTSTWAEEFKLNDDDITSEPHPTPSLPLIQTAPKLLNFISTSELASLSMSSRTRKEDALKEAQNRIKTLNLPVNNDQSPIVCLRHNELSIKLDSWVNQSPPAEREVRQRVKNQIQIINGQLLIEDTLDLRNTNITSLPQDLHVGGYLNLSGCTSLTELPQSLHIGGTLDLVGCTSLKIIPQGLTVGYLNLSDCTSLEAIPQLHVGFLDLNGCTSLTQLPHGLTVKGFLNLSNCTSLEALPQSLNVGGYLRADGCTSLTQLPHDLRVGRQLNLYGCTSLEALPQGITVRGDLHLDHCTSLTQLPQGLAVRGDLYLDHCTNLTQLPHGLTVQGDLHLDHCTSLTQLPQGLAVGRDIHLDHCISLTSLPQKLNVGGNLNLNGCTSLAQIPQGLTVRGDLHLDHCTSLTQLPHDLTVKRFLILSNCTSLTQIPKGLFINYLNLKGCTSLKQIPHGSHVVALNLEGCTRLNELPVWVFNSSNLWNAPNHLQKTGVYKTFQILKHFDTHDTIDGIENQELIDLYRQNQNRIDTLRHNRYCFQIVLNFFREQLLTKLFSGQPLKPLQKTLKGLSNKQTLEKISNHISTILRLGLKDLNNSKINKLVKLALLDHLSIKAITIQKQIRGFLVRKNHHPVMGF